MFIGHYAVGLAAKKVAPQTSLGALLLSVQLIDLLWPIFLLLGLEHVRIAPGNTAFTPLNFYDYPLTHSLVGVLAWSAGLGLIYFAARRYSRGAWVVGAGVLSHWVLDAVVHRPDLLLVPRGQTYVGLSLWNSVPGTLVVEGGMFVAGLALYLRATAARDRVGHYALWFMVALLVILYIANALRARPRRASGRLPSYHSGLGSLFLGHIGLTATGKQPPKRELEKRSCPPPTTTDN